MRDSNGKHMPNSETEALILSLRSENANTQYVCEKTGLSLTELFKHYKNAMKHQFRVGAACTYTEAIADEICFELATGSLTLFQICSNNEDFPHYQTVINWQLKYPEFANKIFAARGMQAQLFIDEIVYLADDAANMEMHFRDWTKLRIDTRKWLATKLIPRIYGTANLAEHTTTESVSDVKSRMDEAKKVEKEY